MATKVLEEMKYCMHCDRETLHRKNSKQMSWLMHLFLTVITFGLWLIVWVIILLWHTINKSATAIGSNWICSNCGAKNSLLHNLGKTIEDELAKDKPVQEELKEQTQAVQSNTEEPINHIVENPTIQEDYKQEDTTKGEIKMENETERIVENNTQSNQDKQGWSWMGFLFAPFYYAGYGKIKKGLVLLLLQMLPLVGLGVMIYAGLKARKELPIGTSLFSWGGVWKMIGISTAILIAFGFAGYMIISSMTGKTPKCGDEEVQLKLYEIIKTETAKNFKLYDMGVLDDVTWETLKAKLLLSDFRTTAHNDEIDSYECSANMTMEGIKSPFTYSVSKLDDGELYVESKDIIANTNPNTTTIPPEPIATTQNTQISHCSQDERIVFSCNTGKKIVSVCASQDISPNSGYLQYRFGKLGSPEAIIPSNPQDFRSVAYGWSAKMGSGIGFGVGNFDYSIDTYEGGILTVSQDKKPVATLTCIQDGFFVDDSGDIINMLVNLTN